MDVMGYEWKLIYGNPPNMCQTVFSAQYRCDLLRDDFEQLLTSHDDYYFNIQIIVDDY